MTEMHSPFGTGLALQRTRGIHFLVTFWGPKYRHYFETCLWPSLSPQLGPNDQVIICCPGTDFDALTITPPMGTLHWVPFTLDPSRPVYWNQNEGQKKLYLYCFRLRLLASMQSPDQFMSQGSVATLHRYASQGYQVVQHTALRQNEETFLAEVGARRIFSGRELADLNIRHLHSECSALYEGSTAQPWLPPLRLFRLNANELVIHSFVANPVLMDFSAIKTLNLHCVKHIAVENIFLDKNFHGCRFGHITDSDEYSVTSLTPDYPSVWKPRPKRPYWFMSLGLQMSYYLWPRAGWNTFQTPSYWHGAGDLTPVQMTSHMLRRRWSPWAWGLGWAARIYLLHLLPMLARQGWLRKVLGK